MVCVRRTVKRKAASKGDGISMRLWGCGDETMMRLAEAVAVAVAVVLSLMLELVLVYVYVVYCDILNLISYIYLVYCVILFIFI